MAENIYPIHLKGNMKNGICDDIDCKFVRTIRAAAEAANITSPLNSTGTNYSLFNTSRTIKIDRKINGSIMIKGPTPYQIHFSPKGIILDSKGYHKYKKRGTYAKRKSSRKNRFIHHPIELAVENIGLIDLKPANHSSLQDYVINGSKDDYSITIISPTIDKEHTKKKNRKRYYEKKIQKVITTSSSSLDPKNKDNSTKEERIEELSYLLGCYRVIIKVLPDSDKMLIAFMDERISLLEDKGNAGEMAEYLDTIVMSPIKEITDIKEVIDQINEPTLNQDIEEVRQILLSIPNQQVLTAALNTMQPSKVGDIDLILCNNHSLLYSNICRHFDELECSCKGENQLNIWGKAFGNFQNFRTKECITGYNDRTGGIFVGMDYCPTDTLCFGSGFAFSLDDVKWHNKEADALLNTYYGFLYSSLNYEMCFLETMGSFSYTGIDANRYIRASAFLQRTASSESGAMTYSGRLKGGFNFNLPYGIGLQLSNAVDLGDVNTRKFMEHGACALNLRVNKRNALYLRNEVGIQFSKNYISKDEVTCWTPAVGLKWIYQNPLSGNSVTANFQHQSSQFTVKTRNQIINQISPEISLTANSSDGSYVSTYYEGAFGEGWNSNELGLHIGKNF